MYCVFFRRFMQCFSQLLIYLCNLLCLWQLPSLVLKPKISNVILLIIKLRFIILQFKSEFLTVHISFHLLHITSNLLCIIYSSDLMLVNVSNSTSAHCIFVGFQNVTVGGRFTFPSSYNIWCTKTFTGKEHFKKQNIFMKLHLNIENRKLDTQIDNGNGRCVKETTTRPNSRTQPTATNGYLTQRENPAPGDGFKMAPKQNVYQLNENGRKLFCEISPPPPLLYLQPMQNKQTHINTHSKNLFKRSPSPLSEQVT